MKAFTYPAVAALVLGFASSADAAALRMDVSFSATDFVLLFGDPVSPPETDVSGEFSLVFDTDDVNMPFGDITATPTGLDLAIGNKQYAPADAQLVVVFAFGATQFDETTFSALDLGAVLNGPNSIVPGTDDFFLSFGAGDFMDYSVDGINSFFTSSGFQYDVEFTDLTAVPVPAAGLLLLSGLGFLGAGRRRLRG